MKWSLYNFIIRNGSDYLLYNSLTNELMACVGGINSLLNEYKIIWMGLSKYILNYIIIWMRKSSLYRTN